MRTTDELPDPKITPAQTAVPEPVDRALRMLTTSANHGLLWFGVGAVGAMLGKRPRRAALRGVASLGMASFVANSVIKPLVGRRRPDPQRTRAARRIGKIPWTSSFPSGHSASAAAFATGAALELPVSATVLGPLAAAVAYSRVHVGVHYKSDVVVGAASGVAVALLVQKLWPAKPFAPAEMDEVDAPALAEGAGLFVVLNELSGSSDGAEQAIRKVLPQVEIVQWDPETENLSDLVPSSALAVGVAGGDGTVASVAALAIERKLPLAVFPAGTLNHFAGALGLATHQDTATAVLAGAGGSVSAAALNGNVFLNTAGIGGYPELVRLRDKLSHRMGKWPAAAYALRKVVSGHAPLHLVINDKPVPVWAVFVGNGVYTPRGLAPAWRDRLSDDVLDVQYLRADKKYSRTIAVVASLIGLVERTKVFGAVDGRSVTITSQEGPVLAAHDGEVTSPHEKIELEILPQRLVVYRG